MNEEELIGFHQGMPHAEYLAIKAMSNSRLKKFKTPAHDQAPQKPPTSQQQTTWDTGTAFHIAGLEPEIYKDRVIVTDAARVTMKEKQAAERDNQIIIKSDVHKNVQAMAEAIRNHPDSGPLVCGGGITEVSCFWEDPDFGFLCKLRADKITDDRIIIDLKSTENAEDKSMGYGSFWKNFTSLRCHWQAYWYLTGISIASGIPHDMFADIACETHPPYGINVFWPDKELLLWALEEIDLIKATYAKCLESGVWPCYETGHKIIGLPSWKKRQMQHE